MEDIFEEQYYAEESLDIMKYIRALFRRWWLVAAVSLAVIVPWFIYLKRQPPVYQADAWISFYRVTGAVSQELVQSRILQLKSRSFAEEVTAELGLTLELLPNPASPKLSRSDIFNKISTNRDPVPGSYRISYHPNGYCGIYFNGSRIDSLRLAQLVDDTLTYNGVTFSLNETIFSGTSDVVFKINDFRRTVSSLRTREEVTFNKEGDVMRIVLEDKDPELAAQTVNMLGETFISKSIQMDQAAIEENRRYLQEQMDLVKKDLDQIDNSLKAFNYNHPIGLDAEMKDIVDRLEVLQRDSTKMAGQKKDLQHLLGKFDYTNPNYEADDLGHYIFRQIASMEVFKDNNEMGIQRSKLNDYLTEKEQLIDKRIPETNEEMIDLMGKISQTEQQVLNLAQNEIDNITEQIKEIRKEMNQKQRLMNRLPTDQKLLINLRRNQRVKEDYYSEILRKSQEAQMSASVKADDVRFIDRAVPHYVPVSGSKMRKAAIGGAAGFFLGILVVLVMEMADRRIRTREDVRRYLQLPILGVIPKVRFDEYELQDSEKAKSISSQIVTHDYSPTPVGEAYRALRTSLLFNKSIGEIKTLAIGSVAPGEGKSFTAANLGITLAQQKSKTLLIDADLRRGVLHNSFNCPKKPGLTNFLTGVVPLETILHETYVPNLTLITCGSLLPNPSELLGSDRMKRFIEAVSRSFDIVIFDTPPLMAASDAVILSTLVDGIAVLLRAGMTNRTDVAQKLELFNNIQTNVLGVILNCAGIEIAHDGYSYYRY